MTYRAPTRDLVFALHEVAGFDRLAAIARFDGVDGSSVAAILAEGIGGFAEGVLAPLNRVGDTEGARGSENGRVFAAPGFADAYRRYVADGWNGLAGDVEYGGQGLPRAVALAVFECVHASNMSFGLCPTLTEAAVHCIEAHGSAAQKKNAISANSSPANGPAR